MWHGEKRAILSRTYPMKTLQYLEYRVPFDPIRLTQRTATAQASD